MKVTKAAVILGAAISVLSFQAVAGAHDKSNRDDLRTPRLMSLSSNVVANIDRVCAVRRDPKEGQNGLRIHFRSKRTLDLRGPAAEAVWNRLVSQTEGPDKTNWIQLGDGLLVNLDCVENVQNRDGSLSIWCVDGIAELIRDEKELERAWSKLVRLAKESRHGLAVFSAHLLLNLENVDCIQSDNGVLRIFGPSGGWPNLKDASEREAVRENLQALQR